MNAESEKDFTGDRVKHLEMIQDVVTRMANSSAWMKRLAIVVVGGVAVLSVRINSTANILPLLTVILAVIFWLMDARYQQQERWFRALFEAIRTEDANQRADFRMTPTKEIRSQSRLWRSAISWSILPYYGALAAFLLLAWRWGS